MISTGVERALRRFSTRTPLTNAGRAAFRALPFTHRSYDAASYVVREGEPTNQCALLLSGFAYRHKVTCDGARQILSVQMAGEFVDLQNGLLRLADHNVQALTRIEVASLPVEAVWRVAEEHPDLGRAMWMDTLVDGAVFREWLVNVGRRHSLSRVAHFLCEFALRLQDAGLCLGHRYELPMTQEQLADATALTPVHVNRVLKELGRLGLIDRNRRAVTIADWKGLSEAGDFSTRYLHRDPARMAVASGAA